MRRSRILVAAVAAVAIATLGAGWVETHQAGRAHSGGRATCRLGSAELRSATAETLAGLDHGVFRTASGGQWFARGFGSGSAHG